MAHQSFWWTGTLPSCEHHVAPSAAFPMPWPCWNLLSLWQHHSADLYRVDGIQLKINLRPVQYVYILYSMHSFPTPVILPSLFATCMASSSSAYQYSQVKVVVLVCFDLLLQGRVFSSPLLQFFQVIINVHHGELVLQVHSVVEVLTGVNHNVDEGHAGSLIIVGAVLCMVLVCVWLKGAGDDTTCTMSTSLMHATNSKLRIVQSIFLEDSN